MLSQKTILRLLVGFLLLLLEASHARGDSIVGTFVDSADQACKVNDDDPSNSGKSRSVCDVTYSDTPAGTRASPGDTEFLPNERKVYDGTAQAEFGKLKIYSGAINFHDEDNMELDALAFFQDTVTFNRTDFAADETGSVTLHWRVDGRVGFGITSRSNLFPNARASINFVGSVEREGLSSTIGSVDFEASIADNPLPSNAALDAYQLTYVEEVVSWTVPEFVWDEPVEIKFQASTHIFADALTRVLADYDHTFELVGMDFFDANGDQIPLDEVNVATDSGFDYVAMVDPSDADLDGNGVVNVLDADLACSSTETSLERVLDVANLVLGDANGDGDVAFDDFLRLASSFGEAASYSQGDFDCSGRVEFVDFLTLATNFGDGIYRVPFDVAATQGDIAATPEPNAAQLMMVMLLLAATRLRTKRRTNG